MYMELTDYHEENVVHQLIFSDIKILKTNMIFGGCAGSFDWLYCEFLAIDKKRLSLEVILFGDSFLYVDFSKLHYKKHLKSKIDRTGN